MGGAGSSIEPAIVVIGTDPATPVSVTVTNERDVGTIAVEKVVEGDPAGSDADRDASWWTARARLRPDPDRAAG